jgi:DNA-binding XRE family transcriptional regulator
MNVTIGNKIKQLRKSTKSMTQEQVADFAFVSSAYARMEMAKVILGQV